MSEKLERFLREAESPQITISELYERAHLRARIHAESSAARSAGSERSEPAASRRHPGRALREDFLTPRNLTPERLSLATGIPLDRLHNVLSEREPVCVVIATALSGFFGGRPGFWLELQARYDSAPPLS